MQGRLQCEQNGHNGNEVNSLCMNPSCGQFRPCCITCLQQNHKDHFQDVFDFVNLPTHNLYFIKIQNLLKILENSKQLLIELEKQIKNKIEEIIRNTILISGNTQEIHQSAQDYLKNQEKFLFYSNIDSPFNSLIDKSEQLLENLKKTTQIFQFSPTLAPNNIKLFGNNTIAQQQQKNPFPFNLFILCDFKLPMNKSTNLKFKIIKLVNWIAIGICNQQKFSKDNILNYSPFGNANYCEGAFLIGSSGTPHSDLVRHANHQLSKGFEFSTNDIIEVMINPQNKILICKKIITNEEYLLPFEVSNDLVPCACLGNYEDSIQIIQ